MNAAVPTAAAVPACAAQGKSNTPKAATIFETESGKKKIYPTLVGRVSINAEDKGISILVINEYGIVIPPFILQGFVGYLPIDYEFDEETDDFESCCTLQEEKKETSIPTDEVIHTPQKKDSWMDRVKKRMLTKTEKSNPEELNSIVKNLQKEMK